MSRGALEWHELGVVTSANPNPNGRTALLGVAALSETTVAAVGGSSTEDANGTSNFHLLIIQN